MENVEITINGERHIFGSRIVDGRVSYFFEFDSETPEVDFGFSAEEIDAATPGPMPITGYNEAIGMIGTAILRAGKE